MYNFLKVSDQTLSAMPSGKYSIELESVRVADTKDGAHKILAAVFSVTEGMKYGGRKIFEYWNCEHHNETVVEIALSQIKSYLRATSGKDFNAEVENITDLCKILNDTAHIPVLATIRTVESVGFMPQNKISSFAELKD